MRSRVLMVIGLAALLVAAGCAGEKPAAGKPPAKAEKSRPQVRPPAETRVSPRIEEPPAATWEARRDQVNRSGVDVVFVFDSTGSMGGIILEMKTRIRQLVKVATGIVPNIRFGLVTYRDWKKYDLDDYEYTVKYMPLVEADRDGLDKLERFLRETEAYGGGDVPEAVQAGVETAIEKAGWREGSKKVMIVIGDAPPHAEDDGLTNLYATIKAWHSKTGGIVSCIDTTGGSKLLDEFKEMAALGGGEATFLNDERAIIRQMLIYIFGSKWQKEIEKAWKDESLTRGEPGSRVLTKESLDDLFDDSPVDSDVAEEIDAGKDAVPPDPRKTGPMKAGAPDWISSGGHLTGLETQGKDKRPADASWGGTIRGLQRTGLDVVIVFDSTGSMGGIILEMKTRIRGLIKVVTYLVPNARVGFVTYRDSKKFDLDDYEYTVKFMPLTKCDKDGLDKLQKFLHETEAYGGGDIPEAVLEGVQTAIEKADWRPRARNVIIVVGDAPPHAEDGGLAKLYALCKDWHDKTGGIVSCIDTTGGSKLLQEFKQMAAQGGGEATFLNDERAIIRQLVVYTFSTQWEKEIDKVWGAVLKAPPDGPAD